MDEKKLGRYSFISSRPFDCIKLKNCKENPLDKLKEKLDRYKVENNTEIPFIGGAVGYLASDIVNYIVYIFNWTLKNPNKFVGIFSDYLNFLYILIVKLELYHYAL